MRNMKNVICAIAALTALLMQSNPALGRFVGTVDGNKPLIVDVRPASSNSGPTSVTITFIDSRGRSDTEVASVPVHDETPFIGNARSGPIPKGTRRIVVEINNPAGGACRLMITQGDPISVVEELVEGDL